MRLRDIRFPPDIVESQRLKRLDSRLLGVLKNLSISGSTISRLFPDPWSLKQTLITPVRFLDLLDGIDNLLTPAEQAYIKKKKANLILDMSVEAAEFSGYTEQKLLSLHEELAKCGIDPSSVFLLNANFVSDKSLPAWAARRGLQRPIKALGYSFYLFEYLAELLVSTWFQGVYPKYQATREAQTGMGTKGLFICLNLRPRPHRLAIMLHLLRRGLIERSVVSYFGEAFGNSDTKSVATQAEALDFVRSLPSGQDLLGAFPKLQAMVPITADRQDAEMRKDLWDRKPGEIAFLFPESDGDGEPTCTTHFEIVTETWFTNNSCLYITEKTLRPIIRMQAFILVGCPGTLAYLRSLGFQTFSPFIDESYDSIVDPALRFEAICREIDRLASLTESQLASMEPALAPRLRHNSVWLLGKGKKIAEREISENVSNKLQRSIL